MQVELRKATDRPQIRITRDDGVILALRPPDRKFRLPHDMVHFVVEQTMGLDRGFWGTLADGALFPSVRITGGRQRPHARERSELLLRSNARSLNEAEAIAGLFQHAMLETPKTYRSTILRRLKAAGREFDPEAIEKTRAALAALRQRWEALDPGGSISLHWKGADKPRAGRRKKRFSPTHSLPPN